MRSLRAIVIVLRPPGGRFDRCRFALVFHEHDAIRPDALRHELACSILDIFSRERKPAP